MKLASVFQNLLGGSETTRRASTYLRQLATNSLPREPLVRLSWHERPAPLEVAPVAYCAPHDCVVAVMCPSVPLRVVWKRGH